MQVSTSIKLGNLQIAKDLGDLGGFSIQEKDFIPTFSKLEMNLFSTAHAHRRFDDTLPTDTNE